MYSRTPNRRAKPHAQVRDRRSTGNQSRPPCDAASSLCGGRRPSRAGASAGAWGSVHGAAVRISRGRPALQRTTPLWPNPTAGACAVTSRGRLPPTSRGRPDFFSGDDDATVGAAGGPGTGGGVAPACTWPAGAVGDDPVVFCRYWSWRFAFVSMALGFS